MTQIITNLYEKEGIENTRATLEIVKTRAEELDIKQLVAATTTGQTALDCAERMPEMKTIVGVTMHAIDTEILVNRHGKKVLAKDSEIMEKARKAGVIFYTGVHPFRGAISSAMHERFQGYSAQDIVSEVLMKFFSTGMKVALECAIMAADGGLINTEEEVIAIGGYRGGADTAVVLRPAFSYRMFEMNVREILAYPRLRPDETE